MSGTMPPPAGAQAVRAPAQGQIDTHIQASQMAHIAATRAAVARVLSRGHGGAGPPMPHAPGPNSFKHHVIAMAGGGNVNDVHSAIDAGVSKGHFTPGQGSALKAHDGPLMGPPGASTIATLGSLMPPKAPM